MNFAPWDHMGGGGFGWMMGGSMILVWFGLIAVTVWLVSRNEFRSRPDRARDLLAERYARGEISTDEYEDRLAHLS